MILYITIITIACGLIAMLNFAMPIAEYQNFQLWVLLITVLSVAGEFLIDGMCATAVHFMKNRWFDDNHRIFQVSKREKRFYEHLHIKDWKDKVWELGGLGGFSKSKMTDPNNPEYLWRFIIENNKGIVVHILCITIGFAIMFIVPGEFMLRIGLPVALVNTLLNLMSILVLRYNIPRLQIAYKRASRVKGRVSEEVTVAKKVAVVQD